MKLDEVLKAQGAFKGTLPTGALAKSTPDPNVIIQAEIIPWSRDPHYVHILAMTFLDKTATLKPIRRDSVRLQLASFGKYVEAMEWSPAIVLARKRRLSKLHFERWAKDNYEGSDLGPT